jgi:hypothetical protein
MGHPAVAARIDTLFAIATTLAMTLSGLLNGYNSGSWKALGTGAAFIGSCFAA